MALSPGCAACHAEGTLTQLVGLSGLGGEGQFAAGERLTVSWGPAPDDPWIATRVTLYVDLATAKTLMEGEDEDGTLVDCAVYPRTIGYTFPADGLYSWFSEIDGDGTISLDCGVAPPFDPVQEITNLKARVAGLVISCGVKDPLIYDLDQALEGLWRQARWGRLVRNRGLASLRRSSTAARFLAWAGPDPCRLLQTFINGVNSAWAAGQLTNAQGCELTCTAKNIRRFLNC